MSSKPIGHTDDASKAFIMRCLGANDTHGFDIDAIHKVKTKDGPRYYLFEYLKDESLAVSPHNSDPKFYPWNWKKFYFLYQMACALNGKLLLINYSDGFKTTQNKLTGEITKTPLPENYKNEVRVMCVKSFDYDKVAKYDNMPYNSWPRPLVYMEYEYDKKMTFDEYAEFLNKINSRSTM